MLWLLLLLLARPAFAGTEGCYCYCDYTRTFPPPCTEQQCIDYCEGGSRKSAPSSGGSGSTIRVDDGEQRRRRAEEKARREEEARRKKAEFDEAKADGLKSLKGGAGADLEPKGFSGGADAAGAGGFQLKGLTPEPEGSKGEACAGGAAERCIEAALRHDAALEAERREGAGMIFAAARVDGEGDALAAYDRIIAWGRDWMRESYAPLPPNRPVTDHSPVEGPARERFEARREREAGAALDGRYDSPRRSLAPSPREAAAAVVRWQRNIERTTQELREFKRYMDELMACDQVQDNELYQSCTKKVNQLYDQIMRRLTNRSLLRRLLGDRVAKAGAGRVGAANGRVKRAREAYQAWVGRSLGRIERHSKETSGCLGSCR